MSEMDDSLENEKLDEEVGGEDVGNDEADDETGGGGFADVAALEHRLLAHLQNPNYRPVKPRVVAKKLGLSEVETREMRRLVKKLVKRGSSSTGPIT